MEIVGVWERSSPLLGQHLFYIVCNLVDNIYFKHYLYTLAIVLRMSDQVIADSELTLNDNSSRCPIWRLRRRQLAPLACITLILSLVLFLREFLSSPQDIEQLKSAQPPSFVPNADLSASTALSTPSPINTEITPSHDEDPVVFVLIIWSEPSATEGALLIKASRTTSCANIV